MTGGRSTLPTPPDPSMTLGPQAVEWMITNLVDGFTGETLRLTDEQIDFIDCWYRVDDNGRFAYRQGVLCRVRGAGKSPLAAYLACLELAGPCRFGGWDLNGEPIAIRASAPWIQIIATAIHQTSAIMSIATACWSKDAIEEYGIDAGKEKIFAKKVNGKMESVSNSPRSLRGARPTLCVLEESSEWVQSNQGHEAMIRINGNLRKSPNGQSRWIQLCNAWVLGDDSLAEQTHAAWVEQVDRGMEITLFDWLQPSSEVDLGDPDSIRQGLIEANGDAMWLDLDTFVAAALDRLTSPGTFRREHLAQLVTEEDNIIDLQVYESINNAPPLKINDKITLGFDGSLSDDGTALVAYRISDKSFHLVGYSEPNPNDENWRVDQGYFDDLIAHSWLTYNVVGFASDVYPWADFVIKWERLYGEKLEVKALSTSPIGLDMRGNKSLLTRQFMDLRTAIDNKKVRFSASGRMKQHFSNARIRQNAYGESFGKVTPGSKRRVDIVAASLLAFIVGVKIDTNEVPRRKNYAFKLGAR